MEGATAEASVPEAGGAVVPREARDSPPAGSQVRGGETSLKAASAVRGRPTVRLPVLAAEAEDLPEKQAAKGEGVREPSRRMSRTR